MAKCVRVVGQGVPYRLSDDDAFQLVHRDGDGEYCSKAFWKRWYDENASEAHRVRAYAHITKAGRLTSGAL